MTAASRTTHLFAAILTAVSLAACVTTDPQTGKTIPRGDQRYFFSEVVEKAKRLEDGMTKRDVLFLLGSPAEKSERRNAWVYLPERAGIVVPARSLKLEFRDGVLTEHGYHAIILGGQL